MNQQEKINEIKKLLLYIYIEWPKVIDDNLIKFWLSHMCGISKGEAWEAAHFIARQKSFGEPKLNDFLKAVRDIREHKRKKNYTYNPHYAPPNELPVDQELAEYFKLRQKPALTDNDRKLLKDLNLALPSKTK